MGIIEAEYDGSVLRPLERIALRRGEHVAIVIMRRPDPARWDFGRLSPDDPEDRQLAEQGLVEWADELDQEDRR